MTFDEMLEMLDIDCCKFCKYADKCFFDCYSSHYIDPPCCGMKHEELFDEDEIRKYFTEKGVINENNKTNEDTI